MTLPALALFDGHISLPVHATNRFGWTEGVVEVFGTLCVVSPAFLALAEAGM